MSGFTLILYSYTVLISLQILYIVGLNKASTSYSCTCIFYLVGIIHQGKVQGMDCYWGCKPLHCNKTSTSCWNVFVSTQFTMCFYISNMANFQSFKFKITPAPGKKVDWPCCQIRYKLVSDEFPQSWTWRNLSSVLLHPGSFWT